jgi:DNA-directed RNA polymerase specialized sigma24 family protein
MQLLLGDAGVADGQTAQALQLHAAASSDLAEFSDSDAARRLAVLEADKELVNRLMWAQYQGPEWRRFTEVLAQYGLQVMRAWIQSGVIFTRCSEKGFGGLKPSNHSMDDANGIAGETVAQAISAFRRNVLVPARWDPTKGASLKTFFVGQCLLQFSNVYRRWVRETQPAPINRELLAQELASAGSLPAPGHVRALLITTLEKLTEDSPEVIEALIEMGYDQVEIAELLHTTRRAIESKLYRHRRRK